MWAKYFLNSHWVLIVLSNGLSIVQYMLKNVYWIIYCVHGFCLHFQTWTVSQIGPAPQPTANRRSRTQNRKKNQFVYLYTINHCDETSTVVIKETTNFLSIALRIHFMKKSRFHFFLLYCDNQRRRMICCPTWRGRGSWAYVRCASQIARGRGSPGCEPGLQTIRKMIG